MIVNLANELKRVIFIDYLELTRSPSELRSMATVCRAFYDFLRPFLWHSISLTAPHTWPPPPDYAPCAAVLAALFPAGQHPLNAYVTELHLCDSLSNVREEPSFILSADHDLPVLLSSLPQLKTLTLGKLDWSISPLLDTIKSCLAMNSLRSVTIFTAEFPVDLVDWCRHVRTLNLSTGYNIDAPTVNANRPQPRHMHLSMDPSQFYNVWRRLDTSQLQTLVFMHGVSMELQGGETEYTLPPDTRNLQRLIINFGANRLIHPTSHTLISGLGEHGHGDPSEPVPNLEVNWPRFNSLAGLRELTVTYPTWQCFDRPRRLAEWLGSLDPIMEKLESLNIYLSLEYPDSLADENIEGLAELDRQLAGLQPATLKNVLIGLAPTDLDESTCVSDEDDVEDEEDDTYDEYEEDEGVDRGKYRAEAGEEDENDDNGDDDEEEEEEEESESESKSGEPSGEVPVADEVTQEMLETCTAPSVQKMWVSLSASRSRAPDFISVKVFDSE
ncbi:hypothetical protein H0H92_009405 [Tricholoma furcatifolium]|nr:hypothetical protein H0H92_009405 [Tricholoma furcatifolium]